MGFKGLRLKFRKRKGEHETARRAPVETGRSWGEDAVATAEEEAAEGTPSGMTRLKTEKL